MEMDGSKPTAHVFGGSGNDTLLGGSAAEMLAGGSGNDFVEGNQGSDIIYLGDGDDTVQWDPGDGSDLIEGEDGNDKLVFNGSNINENLDLSAHGSSFRFFRNVANIVMDVDGVEQVEFHALGGADNVVVNNLASTAVTQVNIDLGASIGGGDGQADSIIINGTDGNDSITVANASENVNVTGLSAAVSIRNSEAVNDRVTINTLAGNDALDASALAAGFISLTGDGGINDDVLIGSGGADVLLGGDGDDVLIGGPGVDVLDGGPGNNVIIQD